MRVKQLIAALRRLPPEARVDAVSTTSIGAIVQMLHNIECVRAEGDGYGLLLGAPLRQTTQHTTGAPPPEGRTGGVLEYRRGSISFSDGLGDQPPRSGCPGVDGDRGGTGARCALVGGHPGQHKDADGRRAWGHQRPICEQEGCRLGWDHLGDHLR